MSFVIVGVVEEKCFAEERKGRKENMVVSLISEKERIMEEPLRAIGNDFKVERSRSRFTEERWSR